MRNFCQCIPFWYYTILLFLPILFIVNAFCQVNSNKTRKHAASTESFAFFHWFCIHFSLPLSLSFALSSSLFLSPSSFPLLICTFYCPFTNEQAFRSAITVSLCLIDTHSIYLHTNPTY